MPKFYKIILGGFIVVAIALLGAKKIFLSAVVGLIGFLFYKLISLSTNNHYTNSKSELKDSQKRGLPDFHWKDIEGKGLQLLESIDIITNTKNLDTLRGRIVFINEIYPGLISYSLLSRYSMDVQKSIDRYKAMYYDKILTSEQAVLLLKPDNDKMKRLFSECVLNCFKRYVNQQNDEMLKLKMDSAKQRRREDIIKKGYDAKYIFKSFELPDDGHTDSIEEIRKQYYSYQKELK